MEEAMKNVFQDGIRAREYISELKKDPSDLAKCEKGFSEIVEALSIMDHDIELALIACNMSFNNDEFSSRIEDKLIPAIEKFRDFLYNSIDYEGAISDYEMFVNDFDSDREAYYDCLSEREP